MKVLIIGAHGMLGHDLLLRYKKLPHEVVGLSRSDIDITDSSAIFDRIVGENPDWVILTAAVTKVDECEIQRELARTVNSEGTLNIAKACRSTSSKLCYISTDYIFNGKKGNPYSEDDEPSPINYYAKTKLMGEKFIMETLDDYLIVRTSWLFGKKGKNFVDTILIKAQSQMVLKVVNDQTGSPTYTRDLANSIIFMIEKDVKGIINVTNEGFCSWFEFAKEILTVAGVSGVEVQPIESKFLKLPAKRPANSRLALDKFRKLNETKMRSWQAALREYIKDYSKQIFDNDLKN